MDRDTVEPMSRVECIGTIAAAGKTVLVTASTIRAPPDENAALLAAARKLPAMITYNASSRTQPSKYARCFHPDLPARVPMSRST